VNQTIDPQNFDAPSEQEIPNSFVVKMLCLAGALLLMAKISEQTDAKGFLVPTRFVVSGFPYLYAAAQTVYNGLLEFSGREPGAVEIRLIVSALASLLLSFVIGPTAFFFSLRRYHLTSNHPKLPAGSSLLGMIITVPLVISVIPVAVLQYNGFHNLKRAQAEQFVKDGMIKVIVNIAQDARIFHMLPKEKGGGGGSYDRFVPSSQLKETEWSTFSVKTVDDALHITGTVTKNPSLRFGMGKPDEIPFGRISLTLTSAGDMRKWDYDGVFK